MAVYSSPENSAAFLPVEWEEAANAVAYDSITSPPPICVVCGPPNSGKSTFSRHLLNVFINRYQRAAYMDTNVGRPEFTPSGCLSLTVIGEVIPDLAIPCLRTPERYGFYLHLYIGIPPYFHHRCFFFGDITPRTDPNLYLAYIHALYDYYHEKYQHTLVKIGVPLVVKALGFVEGIELDMLVEVLKYISPAQIVKICVSAEITNQPPLAFWSKNMHAHQEVTLLEINSNRQDHIKKSVHVQNDAILLRDVSLLAYFRKCFPTNMSLTTIEELDHRLSIHPPYEILMSSVTIKQLHPKVRRAETINTSNSIIVGLGVSTIFENLPLCVGLGIVRGVDTSRKSLYLVTPVPKSILKNVDLLLHGLIKIPACLQQVQRHICNTQKFSTPSS